jgi:TRAP-type mannitol/chloroaromatic compound transport system permease large subunit
VVFGALLAATTGVVAASVISMGLISLPIMLRYGYDRRVASGVIAHLARSHRSSALAVQS